jgi:hypothetical protein
VVGDGARDAAQVPCPVVNDDDLFHVAIVSGVS